MRTQGLHLDGPCAGSPLLLSGKYSRDTEFREDDHRNSTHDGAAFDVGENLLGCRLCRRRQSCQEFSGEVPDGVTTAQAALAWAIAQDGLTTVIPGAVPRRRLGQTLRRERCTTSAAGLPPAPWTSPTVTSAKRFIRAGKEGSDAVTNRRASAYVPFGHRRALPFRPAGLGVGSDGPLRFRL
jgi:hypothetical protein